MKKIIKFGVDSNQSILLVTSIICTILGASVGPALQKEIISALPAKFLAIQGLVAIGANIIVSHLWQLEDARKRVILSYRILTLTESVAGFCLAMYLAFIDWNVYVFAIASLIYTSLISMLVGKATSAFSNALWKGRKREDYKNEKDLWHGYAGILGLLIAATFTAPLRWSLVIWGITCILDDLGWIIIYLKNKNFLLQKTLTEEKDEEEEE